VKPQPANALDKPVLDQETFQQLLAAAYTLQEQNVQLPVKEVAASSPLTLSKRPQSKLTQPTLLVECDVPSAISGSRYRMVRRRISQSNELFWRAATAVAMAAVSALLLGASIDRFSPLPARLTLPSEVIQQQVPFRRAKHVTTVLSQSNGVGTKVVVMEPHETMTTEPDEPTVADDDPLASAAPASTQETIVNRNRHSTYESEADMVAPDTVVRYGAPRAGR
jgi:hypothetical protein